MKPVKLFLAFLLSFGIWAVPEKTYAHQSVLLDCGRKYWTVGWIENLIDKMEENHANELILHFSDNMGLRIESEQYPWLAGSDNAFSLDPKVPDPDPDKVYTQSEIRHLVEYGKQHGIELIPGFDSPGHLHYVLDRYEKHYGKSISVLDHPDVLDLANPEGVDFIHSLILEYADLFSATQFDIGGDELFKHDSDWQAQTAWAEKSGTAYNCFISYMNETDALLRKAGIRQCRMYSDQLKDSDIPLSPSLAIAYWQLGPHTPKWCGKNHEVLNYLNFYLYDVLDPDLKFVGATPAAIEREFVPAWFCGWPADKTRITGSCLCLWADIPGSESEQEAWQGFYPLLKAWGEKNGHS